jgi:hypothetical protein
MMNLLLVVDIFATELNLTVNDVIYKYVYTKYVIHKSKILPVVLYECETWSLTLREEHRLRVFENRVLRRIFGSKRDVVTEWRKLHNEDLHNFTPRQT